MSNLVQMAIVQSIYSLASLGWSRRRIARELGIDRATVGKYLQQRLSGSKPAIVLTGELGSKPATLPVLPARIELPLSESAESAAGELSKPAIVLTGPECGGDSRPEVRIPVAANRQGRKSDCFLHRARIIAAVEQGLHAKRIWQDLAVDGIVVGYDSVRRFVVKHSARLALPFRRMERAPGEEAQVDFGMGAPVIGPDGRRRKTYVFRIVLSHSRKGYSEATFTQTTEDFIRCLENAFAAFGGTSATLVIDNLKAAVAHPDWFDPILTPKVAAFAAHCGTTILPAKPYTPRHKGKVEAGVKYVQNNALKARKFASLDEQNQFLHDWERSIADMRIHGTTKQQVGRVFVEIEREKLLKLPLDRFACFREAQRKVSRDAHVEVAKAYYSVPPEYLGRSVWVRWDARLVRIFNHRFEQIAIHARHEMGRFSTQPAHLAKEKISGIERGANYLLSKVSWIGPQSHKWAEAMLHVRGIEGLRVLQGLLALTKKHPSETLEKATECALTHGCFRLRAIRQLIARKGDKQSSFEFLQEHPVIRPMADYGAVVQRAMQRQDDRAIPDRENTIPQKTEAGFRRNGWAKTTVEIASTKNPLRTAQVSSPAAVGSTDLSPPRSGYPSSGCSPALPDSVSPDRLNVISNVRSSTTNPENSHE